MKNELREMQEQEHWEHLQVTNNELFLIVCDQGFSKVAIGGQGW